jgi:hypothetical protein
VALLAGASTEKVADEIKTRRLVVLGPGGDKIADIGTSLALIGCYGSGLNLYDAQGKPRLALCVSPLSGGDPHVSLLDKGGRELAVVKLQTYGSSGQTPAVTTPELSLSGAGGGSARLIAWHDGAVLSLNGGQGGTEQVYIGAHDGAAKVRLTGGPRDPELVRQEQQRWGPGLKEHAASLVDGNTVSMIAGDNRTQLILWDTKGVARLQLGQTELQVSKTEVVEKRPASSVTLFDKDGNLIWKAP